MTDKEKIELIIQDKHLNNTEFCNEVCISPGTLSHIRSGRTEPTLNILRSISQAFPDINRSWLFYGEGPMYVNQGSPTQGDASGEHLNNVSEDDSHDETQLNLFAFDGSAPSGKSAGGQLGKGTVGVMENLPMGAAAQGGGSSRRGASLVMPTPPLNVQEIVAETLKQHQKPQRKVVEVRIFFDDGTFETFSAK